MTHIYTISELTRNIRIILEDSFQQICVEGEVSNLKSPSSGHLYFTLKDEYAQLNCVIFKTTAKTIKFELADGMKVVSFGRLSVYERSGQYQLYIDRLEPKGLGALQIAFEQLKARLAKEGLFDPIHKKAIPSFPQRIGVITSPTGAVIKDILNILDRRFQNLHIIISPVAVQGEGAGSQIAQAIEEFNKFDIRLDVLIIARGGGSLEDLWPFNEEVVARAIYNSRIPIISAVGHQADSTIADFVADASAPTPSAAAEMVIARKQDIIDKIDTDLERLNLAMNNIISQIYQQIDDLAKNLTTYTHHIIAINRERLSNFSGRLEALSPLKVLSRGYSITFRLPQREVVCGTGLLNVGARVETRLYKGMFVSRIEEIQNEV